MDFICMTNILLSYHHHHHRDHEIYILETKIPSLLCMC